MFSVWSRSVRSRTVCVQPVRCLRPYSSVASYNERITAATTEAGTYLLAVLIQCPLFVNFVYKPFRTFYFLAHTVLGLQEILSEMDQKNIEPSLETFKLTMNWYRHQWDLTKHAREAEKTKMAEEALTKLDAEILKEADKHIVKESE